jgi:H+/Cl- antiporter ClcA
MRNTRFWLVVAGIGIIDAVLLRLFEFVGVNITNWLWTDIFKTDRYRWMLFVAAELVGLILTLVIFYFKQKRLVPPITDLMDETKAPGPVKLSIIGVILAIGAMSLLAGASLGPEAALMAASAAIGAWAAASYNFSPAKQLLVLASIGALLVAFLGSIILVLVPLLELARKKQLEVKSAAAILLAGITSLGTLLVIDHQSPGYGSLPPLPALANHDYVIALIIGFITAFLATCMSKLIVLFWKIAERLDNRTAWYVSTSLFSLVLAGLYFCFGRTIEFSGSVGSNLLAANASSYGTAAIIGLVFGKLLVTGWSKGTGFRGGLVFPSIYIGLALGLLVGHLNESWGGAGAIVGGIAGMISAVTGSPIVAAIFVLAILPFNLVVVSLSAIVGTVLFKLLARRLLAAKATT